MPRHPCAASASLRAGSPPRLPAPIAAHVRQPVRRSDPRSSTADRAAPPSEITANDHGGSPITTVDGSSTRFSANSTQAKPIGSSRRNRPIPFHSSAYAAASRSSAMPLTHCGPRRPGVHLGPSDPIQRMKGYRLQRPDVVRLESFRTLDRLEFDGLSVIERLVPVHDDLRPVAEHVLATLDGDEAVALLGVEPLHSALRHDLSSRPIGCQAHGACRPGSYSPHPSPEGKRCDLLRTGIYPSWPNGAVRSCRPPLTLTARKAPGEGKARSSRP